MTKPNDEAFPVAFNPGEDLVNYGLTKLEYFAAMAMQGLLSAMTENTGLMPDETADEAIRYATALINKLNEEGPKIPKSA